MSVVGNFIILEDKNAILKKEVKMISLCGMFLKGLPTGAKSNTFQKNEIKKTFNETIIIYENRDLNEDLKRPPSKNIERDKLRTGFCFKIQKRIINLNLFSERRRNIALFARYCQSSVKNNYIIDKKVKARVFLNECFTRVRALKNLLLEFSSLIKKFIAVKDLLKHIAKNYDLNRIKKELLSHGDEIFLKINGYVEFLKQVVKEENMYINGRRSLNELLL